MQTNGHSNVKRNTLNRVDHAAADVWLDTRGCRDQSSKAKMESNKQEKALRRAGSK